MVRLFDLIPNADRDEVPDIAPSHASTLLLEPARNLARRFTSAILE
jgi:hypothetical protein